MLCSVEAVDFKLYGPANAQNGVDGSAPVWLDEARNLRSAVLYAKGRRPEFGPGGARFGDTDPRDLRCFHVTARVGGRIIGCVRTLPLGNNCCDSVLDDLMGSEQLERSLESLDVTRDQCVECSRLMLDPEFRRSKLARQLVGAVWSIAMQMRANVILAGMGTCDYQDRFIERLGGQSLPHSNTIRAEVFNDDVRPMFAPIDAYSRGLADVVREMSDHFFPSSAETALVSSPRDRTMTEREAAVFFDHATQRRVA
jgi:hypothetical protein